MEIKKAVEFVEKKTGIDLPDEKIPSDSGTVIKSMDYSGKTDSKEYSLEYKNARIVGVAEVNGKKSLICTYRISINEHIRIFGENGRFTEISSGSSPYIVDDSLYYIKNQCLCRNSLSGNSEETVTDRGCMGFCIYKGKLYYTNAKSVFVMDGDGRAEEILRVVEKVSIQEVLKGVGVKTVETVNPLELSKAIDTVKRVSAEKGVKAIVFKSPCAVLIKGNKPAVIDSAKCTSCKKCIKTLGCPGIVLRDGRVTIENSLCTGCGLCSQVCPFKAIGGGEDAE